MKVWICMFAVWIVAACSPSPFRAEPAERTASGSTPPVEAVEAESGAAAGEARESLTVRYWVAGCSVSEDLWRYRKSSTVTCDERGRVLEGARGALVWPDYVTAAEVDMLIVEGDGLDQLRFELWWSPDDEFTPVRSVEPIDQGSTPRQVRFDLAAAPSWEGRVRRFRLTWSGTPPPASRVLGARGVKRGSESEPVR